MKGRGLRIYAILYLIFLYAPILILPLFACNNGTIISRALGGQTPLRGLHGKLKSGS